MNLTEFFTWTFYGNSTQRWLLALVIAVAAFMIFLLAKRILFKRMGTLAATTALSLDDYVADLLQNTKTFFLLAVSLYAGALVLSLPAIVRILLDGLVVIALFIQAGIWGDKLIYLWVNRRQQSQVAPDSAHSALLNILKFVSRLILWSVVLLLVLDNMGIEITALIAGLGIGGIAIGLAVQNVLGDLFASLSILLDKPFVVGDFIIVGDFLGTVERIGIKTTRVRSLSGEELIFSNNDLVQSRLRNFKTMEERRVVFSIGVTYQTPAEKIAAIPQMIQEIIEAQEQIRFDRAHFKEYGDSALNFEIVYYVLSPDYNLYMDIQQTINLAIFRRFEEKGIEFAYPTRTLHLTGQKNLTRSNEETDQVKKKFDQVK